MGRTLIAVLASALLAAPNTLADELLEIQIEKVNQNPVKMHESPNTKAPFREFPKERLEAEGHVILVNKLSNGWMEIVVPDSGEFAFIHPAALRLQSAARKVHCSREASAITRLASGRGVSSFNCSK